MIVHQTLLVLLLQLHSFGADQVQKYLKVCYLCSGILCVCMYFWAAEVSHVLLRGEVQEQEPIHSGAGGPRQ